MISSASARSTRPALDGGSPGSSRRPSSAARRRCASSTVRRVASVGCAVRTSSMEPRGSCSSSSRRSCGLELGDRRGQRLGAARVPRARTRGGGARGGAAPRCSRAGRRARRRATPRPGARARERRRRRATPSRDPPSAPRARPRMRSSSSSSASPSCSTSTLPEQVAEEPDVGAKCGIGRHGSPAYCHAERSQTEDGSRAGGRAADAFREFCAFRIRVSGFGVAPTKAARSGEDVCTR